MSATEANHWQKLGGICLGYSQLPLQLRLPAGQHMLAVVVQDSLGAVGRLRGCRDNVRTNQQTTSFCVTICHILSDTTSFSFRRFICLFIYIKICRGLIGKEFGGSHKKSTNYCNRYSQIFAKGCIFSTVTYYLFALICVRRLTTEGGKHLHGWPLGHAGGICFCGGAWPFGVSCIQQRRDHPWNVGCHCDRASGHDQGGVGVLGSGTYFKL